MNLTSPLFDRHAPLDYGTGLGRKQSASNDAFLAVARNIERIVPVSRVRELERNAVTTIARACAGKRAAFGWSGGKDSQALRIVAEKANVRDCVFVTTQPDLEYPAFLAWVTENMPDGLTVERVGLDLAWLAAHPDMLFPKDSIAAGKWFRLVQHTGQERYFKRERYDILLLGRRVQDGNFVGPTGCAAYKSRGVVRWSPIHHWTHEEVIAVCHYNELAQPPTYSWPNGFVVGTGPWPARQYTGSNKKGWADVYDIDPSVVELAATKFFEAADELTRRRCRLD